MSSEPSDETTPHGFQAGVALVHQAQDSDNWRPVVDWLVRHPECAEEIARFMSGEAEIGRAVSPMQKSYSDLAGATLGGFAVREVIGKGGSGVVFRAFDPKLKRDVALKVVRTSEASPAELARFRFEAAVVAALDHPNIVPVLSFDEDGAVPYLVMPLMTGGSLDAWLKGLGPDRCLEPKKAAEIVRDIARGVHHAHQGGLIHRDLKPGNILLDRDGVPHVADFGLARLIDVSMSASGGIAGTAAYMAPEQARGEKVLTVAVDVHALGVILFELLTGRTPFEGGDIASVMRRVIEEPAPSVRSLRRDVGKDLAAVCAKCLEKEPARRYISAQELADDLQRFLNGEPVRARLPGIWGKAVRAVLWQQFDNPRAWGRLAVWSGALSAAFYLFCAWAITARLPPGPLITVAAVNTAAVAVVYWAILRHRRFRGGDRHTLIVLIVTVAATALLPVLYRPPEGGDLTTYRLSAYPLLALITGVSYLALAYPSWAGYYLIAAGYLVLAIVFKLVPAIGPWVFAVAHGGQMILIGVYLIRLDREPEPDGAHLNLKGNR